MYKYLENKLIVLNSKFHISFEILKLGLKLVAYG